MERDTFITVVDEYLEHVRTEATKLYDDGCAHDRCVPIALGIVDAKDIKKARTLQQIVLPAAGAVQRVRN
ncbi:MAG: hypothetical protein AUI15_33890 [Actinobacteria bacterium 13_2_20CM_2_66_6]|nr:MAG: hypothetical protein AUI15_33890 [Actinobacteria bacterium 13_2_20CM_2_66_6]